MSTQSLRPEPSEPWTCTSCGHLMYNLDAEGYPAPGAPLPRFWDTEHTRVCLACYGMVLPLATQEYWKALHAADKEAMARRKDDNDRLTGRKDYFTGL